MSKKSADKMIRQQLSSLDRFMSAWKENAPGIHRGQSPVGYSQPKEMISVRRKQSTPHVRREEDAIIQNLVRDLLKTVDPNMSELSRDLGIHRVNLQQFKGGYRDLSMFELGRIAEALGYRIEVKLKRIRKGK